VKLYITEASIFVLLIFYLPLVLFFLWRIVRSKRLGTVAKTVAIPIFLIIAYAIPLGDVTLNSIAMAKVCPKAGLHVYKQVQVEGYFDRRAGDYTLNNYPYRFVEIPRKDGQVIRLERQEDGRVERTVHDKTTAQYEVVYEEVAFNRELGVENKRYWIRDRDTQDVLGEWLEFGVLPGWLDRVLVIRWFGGSIGACGNDPEAYLFRSTILQPK